MPIPSNPSFLQGIIGASADVLPIPAQDYIDPTQNGALNYATGWPAITALPLEAGGKAPRREYFNALAQLLSSHIFFQQSGSLYQWSATLDYLTGAHVLGSDGKEYIAQKSNGPDVPDSSAVDPVGDDSGTWLEAGSVYAPLATANTPGIVRPDGETCVVVNGVLSSFAASYNTRLVLTESDAAWASPVSGWARVTVIGGGGEAEKGVSEVRQTKEAQEEDRAGHHPLAILPLPAAVAAEEEVPAEVEAEVEAVVWSSTLHISQVPHLFKSLSEQVEQEVPHCLETKTVAKEMAPMAVPPVRETVAGHPAAVGLRGQVQAALTTNRTTFILAGELEPSPATNTDVAAVEAAAARWNGAFFQKTTAVQHMATRPPAWVSLRKMSHCALTEGMVGMAPSSLNITTLTRRLRNACVLQS